MSETSDDLTLLGRSTTGPVDHVETFPAPDGCTRVVFTTDEVASLCPVTGQPDISSVRIDYVPGARCIESKSLKLFLWGFRDRSVFAEALAVADHRPCRSFPVNALDLIGGRCHQSAYVILQRSYVIAVPYSDLDLAVEGAANHILLLFAG